MNNSDDFWTKQFVKHEARPGTSKAPAKPVPARRPLNPASVEAKITHATEEPAPLWIEKILLAARSNNSNLSFEEFVSLVLSKVPIKARTACTQWLLDSRLMLTEKFGLAGSTGSEGGNSEGLVQEESPSVAKVK